MADLTFTNSGTFDGLDATLQVETPKAVAGQFQADIILSQDGLQPVINIAFAIDTSGSTEDTTGIDFNGDGTDDTFLEAQIFAAEELLNSLAANGYGDEVSVTIVDYAGNGANSFTAPLSDPDALLNYVSGLSSGGFTPYDAALGEVEDAWDTAGISDSDSNFLYFFSDGFPFPANQDYQTNLTSLEEAYDPAIRSVGFGDNTSVTDLNVIDNSGLGTAIINDEDDLDALLTQPPLLPEVESFDIIVDGDVLETIPFDDPRVSEDPVLGVVILDLDVAGYDFVPGAEPSIEFEVRTNFSNGETLTAGGDVTLLDGIVEGTAAGDLIDVDYADDPECDKVDAEDNIDPNATGTARNDDLIFGFGGNDTIVGAEGSDTSFGGEGDDLIVDFAPGGTDTGTNDAMSVDEGNDTLEGGAGDDTLDGGADNDSLVGGTGADSLTGGAGSDRLFLGSGDSADEAFGGDDRDTFFDVGAGDSVEGGEGGDDFDVLNLEGLGPLRVNFLNDDPLTEAGTVVFYDGNGFEPENVTGQMEFIEIEQVIPCFTPGSLILTDRGDVAVEALSVGDRVVTRDDGVREIRWVGRKSLTASELRMQPRLRPVLVKAGALGDGLPARDLCVSPNHRFLIGGAASFLHFGEPEVLVAAKHLLGRPGVTHVPLGAVTYLHIMFDRHQVVLSDGAWTESFQPGDLSLQGVETAQREELLTLFPSLATSEGLAQYSGARVSLKKHEVRLLGV
ncbi:MAG: Hint domain-containing protein [Pseudomonadota bacterium]